MSAADVAGSSRTATDEAEVEVESLDSGPASRVLPREGQPAEEGAAIGYIETNAR